jgi:predicted nucleic acid-binding protein
VKIFLDSSVLLAAAGSSRGASRAIFDFAADQNWNLVSSPFAVHETLRNLSKLAQSATAEWVRLRRRMTVLDDVFSLNRPVLFAASKDRPILFTALAWADVLLTLDKRDFADLLGGTLFS